MPALPTTRRIALNDFQQLIRNALTQRLTGAELELF
jgi:hypothetical protein